MSVLQFFQVKYSHLFYFISADAQVANSDSSCKSDYVVIAGMYTYNIYFCKKVILYTTNLETWNFGKIFRNLPFFSFIQGGSQTGGEQERQFTKDRFLKKIINIHLPT